MIVATAGHVDHGKTSLIKQLTGVDTDRLAEEKRRGLSINLGFAYLPRPEDAAPSGATATDSTVEQIPLGFIDVPGHQRFINTMIAGIGAIDLGMLVIAADDGPMPQTREHAAILELLDVRQACVVLTKVDRVSKDRLANVRQSIDALLEASPWRDYRVFPVDNINGTGVTELREYLLKSAEIERPAPEDSRFFLSIDRAFNLKGAGLVVTGTIAGGSVRTGDQLVLQPAGSEARVRGMHVHDQASDLAVCGQRVALNLTTEVKARDLQRGDWLLAPDAGVRGARIDVAIKILPDAAFALKAFAPVKMYLGARRVAARLQALELSKSGSRMDPGYRGAARLHLDEDIYAFRGQRFVLRDHAEEHLLGGGMVLSPQVKDRNSPDENYLKRLTLLGQSSPAQAMAGLLELGEVLEAEAFSRESNLVSCTPTSANEAAYKTFDADGKRWWVQGEQWRTACEQLVGKIRQWHQEHPTDDGLPAAKLMASMAPNFARPLLTAALTHQLQQEALLLQSGKIKLAGYKASVTKEEVRDWERLHRHLTTAGNEISLLSEMIESTRLNAKAAERTLLAPAQRNTVQRISARRFALTSHLYKLARSLMDLEAAGVQLTVINVKNHWGYGRAVAIEVMEYFDSVRFTARNGDTRKILDPNIAQRWSAAE